MTHRDRWPLRLTVLTLAALLAPVTVTAARGDPRDLVAIGSLVSLDRNDDGTGTLVALVRSIGPRGETTRAGVRPGEAIFLLSKETRFLKEAGPDVEAAAMKADQLREAFTKGTSVTIRCYPASSKLVATEVSAGGPGAEAAAQAEYRAEQKDQKLTVFARGSNNTGGWKNELTVLHGDTDPPEFRFTQTRPRGPVTQVITRFSVQATVDAPAKVDVVFVTDAAGKHKVAVRQVP